MTDGSNTKQPLPLWRRIAFALIVLAMAGMVAMMLAGFIIGKRFGAKITTIHKAGQPLSFSQLANAPEKKPADDSEQVYKVIFDKIQPESLGNIIKINVVFRSAIGLNALDQLPQEMHQAISASLNSFRPTMLSLDTAAKMPLSTYDIGIQNGGEVCRKKLLQLQSANYFLSIRTLFLISANQYDKAADSIVTMIKTLRTCDTYPIISAYSMKQQLLKLACDDTILLLRSGQPSDAKLDRLVEVLLETANPELLTKAYLAEQVFQVEATRYIIPEKIVRQLLSEDIPNIPERLLAPGSTKGLLRVRMIVSSYFDHLAGLIEASCKPWPAPKDYADKNRNDLPKNLISQLTAAYTMVDVCANSTAAVRATSLAVVVEKFRRANNTLPESLDDIAFSIDLTALDDPYTGQKMIFKKLEKGFMVYSTGPDKTDSGGMINVIVSSTTGKIEKMPEDVGVGIAF